VSFGAPDLLLGLIAVPFAAVGYVLLERRRARRADRWSREAMLPNAVWRPTRRLGYLPATLFLLALTLLLVGFARPRVQTLDRSHPGTPTIVLTLDVSGSMAAKDLAPTRLLAARRAAIEFLRSLPPTYKVALVTFGDEARLRVAPTLDRKKVIANIPATVSPRSGTSIGDAIGTSLALVTPGLRQGVAVPIDRLHPPGAVVLISDGTQTGGGTSIADATSTAYVYGIPIDAISTGTPNAMVTQPLRITKNLQTTIKISVPASPATLQRISQQTGGTFANATSAAQLRSAARQLTATYKTNDLRAVTQDRHRPHELSVATAALALVFIVPGIILSGRWFGRPA
jgi:Ca-activated chloride channel family protein